jgi:arylsulfatase A
MSTNESVATRQPNVVLINCDDLGWGDLGCYGSTNNKTPAIDYLASQGTRFTSFYQGSPVCSPSRAAMLTGCYPPRIGFGSFDGFPVLFPGQGIGLPPTEFTMAQMLRTAGYRTQMIGKWHCGDQQEFLPTNHGFEHYFGLPYSNDMGRQVDTPSIYPPVCPLPLLLDGEVIEQQPDLASLTARYVAEAVRFMRSSAEQPFFLYLAHLYVHLPIYVQERFARQSTNGSYGAAVESIDWATSVVLHELDRLGLAENTIVIFTSDNGSLGDNPPPTNPTGPSVGGSNGSLRGIKGWTWEGGIRVPGIIRWPRRVAPGSVSDALVTSLDLLPTLANWCGGKVPSDQALDGLDVGAFLLGDCEENPRSTFAYYWMNNLEAVRDQRWKLHFSKRKQTCDELYDLVADPGETANLFDQRPEIVAHLREIAHAIRCELGDARLEVAGTAVRPIGRVDNPTMLTHYDPSHPYYLAEYDLSDRG